MRLTGDIEQTSTIELSGWHYSLADCHEWLMAGQMPFLSTETSNVCNFDCEYCFTVLLQAETALDAKGIKYHEPLPGEMSFPERLQLIDEAADLGCRSYNVVGAGEPTIDRNFRHQVEHAAKNGMIPVVFTNGWVLGQTKNERLAHSMAEFLYDSGASVVVKLHSFNPSLHDEIVRVKGAGDKALRALELLMTYGFNHHYPTRLGIDNILYARTYPEVLQILRYCHSRRIRYICSTFIPTGRSKEGAMEVSQEAKKQLFAEAATITREMTGLAVSEQGPYIGYGASCHQTMGLYVPILGGPVWSCVGQDQNYAERYRNGLLAAIWEKRLPYVLERFNGGCPPRNLYETSKFKSDPIFRMV